MKKLLIIILIASATSCTKTGECYTCSYGVINGYQRPPDNYCGPMPYIAKDAQGNDIPTYCQPK